MWVNLNNRKVQGVIFQILKTLRDVLALKLFLVEKRENGSADTVGLTLISFQLAPITLNSESVKKSFQFEIIIRRINHIVLNRYFFCQGDIV